MTDQLGSLCAVERSILDATGHIGLSLQGAEPYP